MGFLQLQNLSKAFQTQHVFEHIDFQAREGELITLLGPSGCGKSTLLRCIAGLTDTDSGTIRNITRETPQRRDIVMVFQHYALFPNMDVAGNVGFGLRMQGISRQERAQRVDR